MNKNLVVKPFALLTLGVAFLSVGCKSNAVVVKPPQTALVVEKKVSQEHIIKARSLNKKFLSELALENYYAAEEKFEKFERGDWINFLKLTRKIEPQNYKQLHKIALIIIDGGDHLEAYSVLALEAERTQRREVSSHYWGQALKIAENEENIAIIHRNMGLNFFYQRSFSKAKLHLSEYIKSCQLRGVTPGQKEELILSRLKQVSINSTI